jgi:regulatory protein
MPADEEQQSLFADVGAPELEKQLRSALNKAHRLLAFRARSEKELRDSLSRAGFSEAIITTVIDDCRQKRYVDDANFARQFIQSRLRNRPMGRERLAVELRRKGIDDATIGAALDEALSEPNAIILADQLAEKQRKHLASLPPIKARQRLADFLRRRGFDWETIQGTRLWKELEEMIT